MHSQYLHWATWTYIYTYIISYITELLSLSQDPSQELSIPLYRDSGFKILYMYTLNTLHGLYKPFASFILSFLHPTLFLYGFII